MKLTREYKPRPVRFLELYNHRDWQIKIYSISAKNETVSTEIVGYAKRNLAGMLEKDAIENLETYNTAILILHEGREGYFIIISWWIGENLLRHYVYSAPIENPSVFTLYSNNGIITCIWEMAVLWFERNAWVEHVLKKPRSPDIESYLSSRLNADV